MSVSAELPLQLIQHKYLVYDNYFSTDFTKQDNWIVLPLLVHLCICMEVVVSLARFRG